MPKTLTALVLAFSLALAMAACGQPGGAGTDRAAAPRGSDAGDGRPEGDGRLEEPRPEMLQVHPAPWTRARPSSDGRTVTLTYTGGPRACSGLDHVKVSYRPTEVGIGLFEGTKPKARNKVCVDIVVDKATRVELRRPLEGRDIFDLNRP